MNIVQKKLNKMVKYTFNNFSCCSDFCILNYREVRMTWREEFKKKYSIKQILEMSVEELWEHFGD